MKPRRRRKNNHKSKLISIFTLGYYLSQRTHTLGGGSGIGAGCREQEKKKQNCLWASWGIKKKKRREPGAIVNIPMFVVIIITVASYKQFKRSQSHSSFLVTRTHTHETMILHLYVYAPLNIIILHINTHEVIHTTKSILAMLCLPCHQRWCDFRHWGPFSSIHLLSLLILYGTVI